jgi:hypothetical protein
MPLSTTRFLASIQDGKFTYQEPDLLADKIRKLEGKEVWVSLVKKTDSRSPNQNRYYWGVVIKILAQELGYLDQEVHDSLKAKFLTNHSGALPKVESTTNLNTLEFEEYLEQVRTFASTELNIFIPLPNEAPFEY